MKQSLIRKNINKNKDETKESKFELDKLEKIELNDGLTDKQMQRYFNIVDANPRKIDFLKGWYNRVHFYYSIPEKFEFKFKKHVDDYINNKYNSFRGKKE